MFSDSHLSILIIVVLFIPQGVQPLVSQQPQGLLVVTGVSCYLGSALQPTQYYCCVYSRSVLVVYNLVQEIESLQCLLKELKLMYNYYIDTVYRHSCWCL